MTKTLSVSAIQNGTVIDHVNAGQAIKIIHLLGLIEGQYQVTVGLNLPSKRLKSKDLIKIENYKLTHEQANEVTVFSPEATINIISNFEVVEKIFTTLPPSIGNAFLCPNANCITHAEPISTSFNIDAHGKQVYLTCQYCEKTFDRNHVRVKI